MRYFRLSMGGEIIVGLEQEVIDVVDDEWRSYLYNLDTPEEIAEMIGRCMGVYGWRLSGIDGWADQPDSNAKLMSTEFYTDAVEEIDETQL